MVGPPDQTTETALVEAAKRELDATGDQKAPIVVVVREPAPTASPRSRSWRPCESRWLTALVVGGGVYALCTGLITVTEFVCMITAWFAVSVPVGE